MELFVNIKQNYYRDSIQTLFATSLLSHMDGIERAFVAMGSSVNKATFRSIEMKNADIDQARDNDLIIGVIAESEEIFQRALNEVDKIMENFQESSKTMKSCPTVKTAVEQNPAANVCVISIPGEYVRTEAERALNSGLHLIIFSSNVPAEDEKAIKELAREKGLLCMGPDCGVVNLNDIAFILASINARGPFGICGASGVGIQHVAALLHQCGSGVTQVIGTGGNDLKYPIGGISMLMGIDALENDPETKYIILVSRKPEEQILKKILNRVSVCQKPVVVYFMGCSQEMIAETGAVWAANLDDAAQKALALIGKSLDLGSDEAYSSIAKEAISGMSPEQKYARGNFTGGTYCDEAMRAMSSLIGKVYSNCPLEPELKLKDSNVSFQNSAVDYGEEEFTLGRPHPVIDPFVRQPAIAREVLDPEVAVLLFDFILSPGGHMDPAGAVIEDIKRAMRTVENRGGRLAVVASVCGTDADLQNRRAQEEMLRRAGVIVCPTNYRAALLAGQIIRLLNEVTADE